MKYLKWILCLLVIVCVVWPNPSDASSRRRRFLLAVIAAKGGEAGPSQILSEVSFETSEGFSDASGGEVDIYNGGAGEQGWIATHSAQYFIVNTGSGGRAHTGDQGLRIFSSGLTARYLSKEFTAQSSPFWVDIWTNLDRISSSDDNSMHMGIGTTSVTYGPEIRAYNDGTPNVQYYAGAAWNNLCTSCLSNDTFIHLQLYIMPSGTDCQFDLWVDGTEYNNSGSHFDCANDVTNLDYFEIDKYSTKTFDWWIDDFEIYSGTRKTN